MKINKKSVKELTTNKLYSKQEQQNKKIVKRFSLKTKTDWSPKHFNWYIPTAFEQEVDITFRNNIDVRKRRFDWNIRYSEIVNHFSHILTIKYLDTLQNMENDELIKNRVIAIPSDLSQLKKGYIKLYVNYIRWINLLYNITLIGKESQKNSPSKTILKLTTEFNRIVGHRISWRNVMKFRSKRKKIIRLVRFNIKIVPTRRMFIKLKVVMDKLFYWLYKLPKAREYFGHYINTKALDYVPQTQIIYRKKLKVHLKSKFN